jgi:hypothetical protein
MGKKYPTLQDGEGITLKSKEAFFLSCCDCGLVHKIALVASRSGEIGFALMRDKRRTAQLRRHRDFLKR